MQNSEANLYKFPILFRTALISIIGELLGGIGGYY
jgi:hypothetical protein